MSSPRAGDSVYAAFGVFLLGFGGRAGAYLTPDLGIDAEAQTASMLFMGSSTSGSVGVQYFVGETFYVRAAARVRRLRLATDFDFLNDDAFDHELVQTDLGPDFAIGHRWRHGRFFVSVEWIGAYFGVLVLDAELHTLAEDNGELLAKDEGHSRLMPFTRTLFVHVGASL